MSMFQVVDDPCDVFFSIQVADYCCLEHVVALWKFLNVERAKIKVRDQTVSIPI